MSKEICRWCKKNYLTRKVWENYICAECEKIERENGRSLIPTSPVRSSYFLIDTDKEI